jgi:hypothetical protein
MRTSHSLFSFPLHLHARVIFRHRPSTTTWRDMTQEPAYLEHGLGAAIDNALARLFDLVHYVIHGCTATILYGNLYVAAAAESRYGHRRSWSLTKMPLWQLTSQTNGISPSRETSTISNAHAPTGRGRMRRPKLF